nr:FAD-dependent oxidoreductase [Methylobacterium radiodurans]
MYNEYDVIIVGGGAAGIGAARRLASKGKAVLLLEASARLGGRAYTQDLEGFPLDLGCEWLHSGDRNAWVGIAEASGFPVDRSDPPWAKAHPGIAWDEDGEEAARKAFGDWEERLRTVAGGSDRASDALEPGGAWNAYVRAIAGFMSGVGPENISAADYLAYDDAATGKNWNLPLGYGTLVAASLPSSTDLRPATPVERIDLTADGVAVTTRAGTVRAGAAILTVSTAVLASDAIRLPPGTEPWREAAFALPLGRNEKVFLAGHVPESKGRVAAGHLRARPRRTGDAAGCGHRPGPGHPALKRRRGAGLRGRHGQGRRAAAPAHRRPDRCRLDRRGRAEARRDRRRRGLPEDPARHGGEPGALAGRPHGRRLREALTQPHRTGPP